MEPARLTYRPGVDGLRAVAVLSVILFHLNRHLLPGGYVGVDIFFVISGFLISLNILGDLQARRFSLADFYRRRIKRIAPPMLVVVAFVLIVTQLLFVPSNAKWAARSSFWSILSVANIFFWHNQDTGYFAAAQSDSPLLHLWSLGVEEQFYLLWPVILLLVFRPGRWRALALLVAAVVALSVGIGQLGFATAPSFVYYMLPSRAGELMIGALAAIAVLTGAWRRVPRVWAAPMAIVGAGLIAASFIWLDESSVFPGLLALPPTLGAALLILAGETGPNPVTAALSWRPMVWVGLVSYPAYLWHWPLLSLVRYSGQSITPLVGTGVVVLTLLMAWLSFRLVESPARRSSAPFGQVLLRQFAIPGGLLALLAFVCVRADGFGLRWFSPAYRTALTRAHAEISPMSEAENVCQRQLLAPADATDPRCLLGFRSPDPVEVLLWGDSNAAHYTGMLGAIAVSAGFQFRNLETGGCPPVDGDVTEFLGRRLASDCATSAAITTPVVEGAAVVIVSAIWPNYRERSGDFLPRLFATLRRLANEGKLVILIAKTPVIAKFERRCPEKVLSMPWVPCERGRVPNDPRVTAVNRELRDFAEREPGIAWFDPTPWFCDDSGCSAFDARGRPLFFDRDHISRRASWRLGAAILRQEGGAPWPFTLVARWKSDWRAACGSAAAGSIPPSLRCP